MRLLFLSLCLLLDHDDGRVFSFSVERNRRPTTTRDTHSQAKPPRSVGQAIQHTDTLPELQELASQLWLPTDDELPSHFKTQRIHHEKRQRWASQWMEKYVLLLGSPTSSSGAPNEEPLHEWWQDERLGLAVLSAALPMIQHPTTKTPRVVLDAMASTEADARSVRMALTSLYCLSGRWPLPPDFEMHDSIQEGMVFLWERVFDLGPSLSLPDAIELRWTLRGLHARLGSKALLNEKLQRRVGHLLDQRTHALPFDIVPRGVDWSRLVPQSTSSQNPQSVVVEQLLSEIPFSKETIVTRSGSTVEERRGTAWMVASSDIGALAYSGKLMAPHHPLPPLVESCFAEVQSLVDIKLDCALCNHYPDESAACKFHTDPEHGTVWDRTTCVVAAGEDRRFAFRPIPGTSCWSDWDTVTPPMEKSSNYIRNDDDPQETVPVVVHLFPGDVVKMWDTCNDDFHHAVYKAEHIGTESRGGGRVSLVLKRALDRGRGQRGHGLQGQGKRRKTLGQALPLPPHDVLATPPNKRRRNGKKRRRRS